MTVFKTYFKIVRKHLGFIIMYASIAIGISIVNTSYNAEEEYYNVSSKVGIINKDKSEITNSFLDYLDKNAELIEVEDDKKVIQDTLYDNKVDAIIIIPSNFGEDLINLESPTIEIKKSTQNMSTTIELMTNRYFKLAEVYTKSGVKESDLTKKIENTLDNEVSVEISGKTEYLKTRKLTVFYSFENYAFISIFIFIISTIMCVFNQDSINKRNSISKLKSSKFSSQLFLGHLTLTLSLWLIFIIISIIIYGNVVFSIPGLLFIINSFIFAITITSFAFMVGNLIKNQNVISGIQNIFGLGTSFISGCFISPSLLDSSILNFSKIFPSYWFIDTNYRIPELTEYSFDALKPLITNSAVVLGFGILFFIVSTVVIKRKSRNIL